MKFIYTILSILLLFSTNLHAFDEYSKDVDLEYKILKKIYIDITGKNRPTVRLVGFSEEMEKIFKNETNLSVSCDDADIIIIGESVEKIPNNCGDAPIFSRNYKLYKSDSRVVGAFYWKKGRPNIVLNKKRVKELGTVISEPLKRYCD
jgi:hypothetical protein